MKTDFCQRILDKDEGLACSRPVSETVEVQDKMLGLKFDVNVCDKHAAEYRERSAHARTSRKRTTANH
jgi:hypothetical protein